MNKKIVQLDNGIVLSMIRKTDTKLTKVEFSFTVGAFNEDDSNNGISHVLEHMMFKGTKSMNANQFNKEIDSLGATTNAYTSTHNTNYFISGLQEDAFRFVELLSDITHNSTFPVEELEKERAVIIQEFHQYADDTGYLCFVELAKQLNKDYRLSRPVIGTLENIKKFDREMLLEYKEKFYTGSNLIIMVSGGDFSFDEMEEKVKKEMLSLPSGEKRLIKDSEYNQPSGNRTDITFTNTQPMVQMCYLASDVNTSNELSSSVNDILNRGMSSILFEEIREKLGLVYGIYSQIENSNNTKEQPAMVITFMTTKENVDECIQAVDRTIKQAASMVDGYQMDRIRKLMDIRFADGPSLGFENARTENAFRYGNDMTVNFNQQFIENREQVTIESVKELLTDFANSDYTVVTIADWDQPDQ